MPTGMAVGYSVVDISLTEVWRHIYHIHWLQTDVICDTKYTVDHKKRATFIFTITLANVDRFQ